MTSRKRSSFDSNPPSIPARRTNTPVGYAPQEPGAAVDASAYSRKAGQGTTATPYSRRTTHANYAAQRAKKKRNKIVMGVIAAVLALAVVGVGGAFAYMGLINGKLRSGVDGGLLGVLDTAKAGDPFYVLLMGVDRSEARANSDQYSGDTFRSDSMILARIDPKEKKATLISIVRDTYVDIEGYGYNKINAAHAFGGPELAVKTVSQFAGVPISHYAEIDFDGFKEAVDSLGGIEVNVPRTIDDNRAGGYVEKGKQTLDGKQALILCRARHAYDDMGDGDVYRAANQRMVIGAIAKKLLESDPATIVKTVTSMCDYITTDMSVTDIANTAASMKGMDTSKDIYSCMNPTVSAYENAVWLEYSNNEAWSAMMQRVDKGLSPTVNESDSANRGGVDDGSLGKEYIAQSALTDTGASGESSSAESTEPSAKDYQVTVLNGSGITGAAATASSTLINKGYTVVSTGDAISWDYASTVVLYDTDDQEAAARELAESLGIGTAQKNDGSYTLNGGLSVVIGMDYQA